MNSVFGVPSHPLVLPFPLLKSCLLTPSVSLRSLGSLPGWGIIGEQPVPPHQFSRKSLKPWHLNTHFKLLTNSSTYIHVPSPQKSFRNSTFMYLPFPNLKSTCAPRRKPNDLICQGKYIYLLPQKNFHLKNDL